MQENDISTDWEQGLEAPPRPILRPVQGEWGDDLPIMVYKTAPELDVAS